MVMIVANVIVSSELEVRKELLMIVFGAYQNKHGFVRVQV